jgi:FkbM family methyltransferase
MANLLSNGLKRVAAAAISGTNRTSVPIVAGPLQGMRVPKSVAIQSMGMLLGHYEPGLVDKVLSLAGSIKVAYDVGSHVGYMAVVLCRCGGAERVYAFEPVPSNTSQIREMAAENQLTPRIVIVAKALGDEDGPQLMHSWQSSSMYFLERARDEQLVDAASAFMVETCTMDSFAFDGSNKPPDLVKIDVEGAEELVIKGALQTFRTFYPRILIEIHGPKNAERTWGRLAPLRYEWWHIDASGKESHIRHDDLSGLFSKDSWTAHFFLSKG